eukprot:TRINITY_DN74191_c0_g1_i1.p1 TRINITY_DN74191_c0_g1~~TRINITY_DN74191_c0_g1_i1.p1  ORF type:complete len:260 (-),score=46.69 TRINITY_DN74191_c0_g1_i1:89-868(-)
MSNDADSPQESRCGFSSWPGSSASSRFVPDSKSTMPELEKYDDSAHSSIDAADEKRESLQLAAKKLCEALQLAESVAGEFARRTRSQGSKEHSVRAHDFLAAARALRTGAEIHVGDGKDADRKIAKMADSYPVEEECFPLGSTFDVGASKKVDEVALETKTGCELLQYCSPQDVPRTLVVQGIAKLGIDSLGCLRRYFERYGKVASVLEPHLQSFSSLAFVQMQTEVGAKNALQRGEEQRIANVVVRVSQIAGFVPKAE